MSDGLREHERWWQDNLADKEGQLREWLAESDPLSRKAVYDIAADIDADTVLECGPGLFIDWEQHWKHARPKYYAVERTPALVARGLKAGVPVIPGSIEAIPYDDGAFSLTYARHVLEHLPDWETALSELLRVTRDTAVVVFFRLGWDALDDDIAYDTVLDAPKTYHNTYARCLIDHWLDRRDVEYEWRRPGTDYVLVMRP